jgi:hypothetical protein
MLFFLRGLTEGTVTAKVLSSRKRREKEDRIAESQLFRKRALSFKDKIRPGWEPNSRPSAYKADALPTNLANHVLINVGGDGESFFFQQNMYSFFVYITQYVVCTNT